MTSAIASGPRPVGEYLPMFELNDLCHRLLRSIVTAPLAWQSPPQLATRLGIGLDDATDALADLDVSGWIDPWEMGDLLYVTLSPRGAERLRVRLVTVGRSEGMRWGSIDDPEPYPARSLGRHEGLSALDFVADPTPSPEQAAESAERMARIARGRADAGLADWVNFLPRPTILYGSGLTPWPGPKRHRAGECPGCGSRPLPESAYCLVCDRWGLDHCLATHRAHLASPRPIRNPSSPSANPSAAKAARRAKRRRKWAAIQISGHQKAARSRASR